MHGKPLIWHQTVHLNKNHGVNQGQGMELFATCSLFLPVPSTSSLRAGRLIFPFPCWNLWGLLGWCTQSLSNRVGNTSENTVSSHLLTNVHPKQGCNISKHGQPASSWLAVCKWQSSPFFSLRFFGLIELHRNIPKTWGWGLFSGNNRIQSYELILSNSLSIA